MSRLQWRPCLLGTHCIGTCAANTLLVVLGTQCIGSCAANTLVVQCLQETIAFLGCCCIQTVPMSHLGCPNDEHCFLPRAILACCLWTKEVPNLDEVYRSGFQTWWRSIYMHAKSVRCYSSCLLNSTALYSCAYMWTWIKTSSSDATASHDCAKCITSCGCNSLLLLTPQRGSAATSDINVDRC